MAKQVRWRRGTTTELATFTPAQGEVVIDTDKKVAVVGDGALAGGYPLAGVKTVQTFEKSQRGAITTDNDLSFDLSLTNNFECTPAGAGTLTFTNLSDGQSGYILLINSGGYAISKASLVKAGASFLSSISATGTYKIGYFVKNGSVYVTSSGALS